MIDVRANGSGISVTGIDGAFGDALKVRVSAPPNDGKANAELIALLSEIFGVAKSAITIVSGHAARDKIVSIDGLTVDDVRRALPA